MALVEEHKTESSEGIKKTIDGGSLGMALDILQRGLYAYPIPSTVRELASNAYDAVKEREVAKSILNGTSKVEDHFDVTKTGGIYHSSGWDPTYFDLSWLSDDMDSYIFYDEGAQRDMLRIVDNGVGLGKERLKNYFMLNWSSKRSNKDVLGRWGLGSKVALSLGVSSFRVISRYNGQLFRFDVYLDKVDSIVPKFNSEGKMNDHIVLVDEVRDEHNNIIVPQYIAYYEKTKEKNGVELQVEIKKHNKKLLFEAVESQLMYLPHIKFGYKTEFSLMYTYKDIAANVLYKDEDVVISASTIYNKPHILLGTGDALINYGYVSFRDLELEEKTGAVGLILDINDIEVTPSRESAVWSPKTRDAVLAKYNKVTRHAIELVNSSLAAETDYVEWLAKAYNIVVGIRSGISNSNNALSQLACIIDKDKINDIRFPGDRSILFSTATHEMMNKGLVVRAIRYLANSKKVERKEYPSLGMFAKSVYYSDTMADPLKDRYIFETEGEFVLLQPRINETLGKKDKWILESSKIKSYASVIIPDSFLAVYANEADQMTEDDDTGESKSVVLSNERAKYRKENKMISVHHSTGVNGESNSSYYSYTAMDVYINSLYSQFPNDTLVYYNGGDRAVLSDVLTKLPESCLCMYSRYSYDELLKAFGPGISTLPEKSVRGILVSQENMKYIEAVPTYIPLNKFVVKLYDNTNKKIIFGDYLKLGATMECVDMLMSRYVPQSRRTVANKQYVYDGLPDDLKQIFKYAYASTRHTFPSVFFSRDKGFLGLAYKYALGKIGILPLSDYELAEIMELINQSVPDYLCDYVDEITDLDLLHVDFLTDLMHKLEKVKNADTVLNMLSTSSLYNSTLQAALTSQIEPIIKALNP